MSSVFTWVGQRRKHLSWVLKGKEEFPRKRCAHLKGILGPHCCFATPSLVSCHLPDTFVSGLSSCNSSFTNWARLGTRFPLLLWWIRTCGGEAPPPSSLPQSRDSSLLLLSFLLSRRKRSFLLPKPARPPRLQSYPTSSKTLLITFSLS